MPSRASGCAAARARALVAGAAVLVALASGARADDMDDVLGGFEDGDDDAFAVDEAALDDETARWWDVSGSVELSGSVNYRRHRSDTGTDYGGLQRLRLRGNLALEVDVPEAPWLRDGKVRVEGFGFYDPAYAINGRSDYTERVLDLYELDGEVGEAWIQAKVHDRIDVKLGRQVVIWGRSETLRVLDVLNPLDNREPGRVDIEDLRRPLGMLKVDGYAGDWSLTAIAIPEIRFDRSPVVGSDFYPGTVELREVKPEDFEDGELAARLLGIFPGWDVSLHAAWFWNDLARVDAATGQLVHDRLWMVGSGGNYTVGSWLLKYELAFLDGLGFAAADDEKQRIDALVGVEYYGFTDTTIVFEIANRHLFGHEPAMRAAPDFAREDQQELALRITRNFWHDTLHVTLLGYALDVDPSDGSVVRLDVSYDVRDALTVGLGILLFQDSPDGFLDGYGRNDRLLFSAKWSF
ncbi:MAG: DUF1302 family protein [Myxococcota bacterium]